MIALRPSGGVRSKLCGISVVQSYLPPYNGLACYNQGGDWDLPNTTYMLSRIHSSFDLGKWLSITEIRLRSNTRIAPPV